MENDYAKKMRELRESTGMNRKEFSTYFGIPYPTITDWELGHRTMPSYVFHLLAYKTKMEDLKKIKNDSTIKDKRYSATPYDDAFKTTIYDCKELIYPLLNELFGTHYTKDNIIVFHQSEHFINNGAHNQLKKETDESFDVLSKANKFLKNYHLECQTNPDGTMALRFFQYDTQIAIENGQINNNELVLTLPDSALIYLRCNETTSDKLSIKIITSGGTVEYDIPALKIKDYTIDELFEKKLYVLLPFSMFLFEKNLDECENNKSKRLELESNFQEIITRLNSLEEQKEISSFEHTTILEMLDKTSYNLNKNRPKVQKGVEQIMGGKVLDHPAKTIRNAGRAEAAVVLDYLLDNGRTEDIKRAAKDEDYLNQLVEEYYSKLN